MREVAIGAADSLEEGQRKLAFVDGRSVVVFNVAGQLRAIENSCPHNGASLANGRLDGSVLTCPAHGLRFDLRTGRMPGAGALCLSVLPVRIVEGQLMIALDTA
ncbi:3-phenylpropionate/trans-cinnamate dioxygenase ferredoxin subunit [Paraburkholderia eburnea]|uniref:3-phenylpropionate/trans-cinnamate dioxygenase ferredoxin subunit n=1 Tax=Paraburkholderia eburnea TaxID=1189126 RepID=A0A2S4LZR3_9BURK|nr:Rieske 2Fe-2S domain-containing protein [Paraburkholderia eburnea]POR47962.1 3-phenylpropionate/trans-cinnamate dioxygenase ferredoxin subunit [Paraburkholderia eburnea]PRZ19356.1 3-phenylpropionate/trans-cinnamate dioxygenase ferredoxin subunit [Paraburkholderia eburnea]